MDKFYAGTLAVELTKQAIDSGSIQLGLGGLSGSGLAEFITSLADSLEKSDLPDGSTRAK